MKPERISAKAARPFWQDASQHVMGTHPDKLPDGDAFHYWVCGPICGVFHLSMWPGVWMAHYGVKPEGWGSLATPAKAILQAFWEDQKPERITGWTRADNRAALAFARRIGFVQDGILPLPGGDVVMSGWRLECH